MRSGTLAGLVAAAVACVHFMRLAPAGAPRFPGDTARVFEVPDAAWLQQVGPLFGVAAPAPSAWLASAVTMLAPRAPTSVLDVAAALLIVGMAASCAWLLAELTGSKMAAAGSAVAMATGPHLSGLATAVGGTLRPALDGFLLSAAA